MSRPSGPVLTSAAYAAAPGECCCRWSFVSTSRMLPLPVGIRSSELGPALPTLAPPAIPDSCLDTAPIIKSPPSPESQRLLKYRELPPPPAPPPPPPRAAASPTPVLVACGDGASANGT